MDHRPLILTLWLEPRALERLTELCTRHFPPERNFLQAHLTLFHALPGGLEPEVRRTLLEVCAATAGFGVELPGARSLGRGVAIEARSPQLTALRADLARRWAGWLAPQDRQPHRPHVTVQNKVTPQEARALYGQLAADWVPVLGTGPGARALALPGRAVGKAGRLPLQGWGLGLRRRRRRRRVGLG